MRDRWRLESSKIPADGNLDDDGIRTAFGFVIRLEPRAEPASLNPDDRIGSRIKRFSATEDLDCDRILFYIVCHAVDGMVNQVFEHPSETRRIRESPAIKDAA